MAFRASKSRVPTTVNSSVGRTREYLTGREIERLMAAARKYGRYGHRDATMILITYRHGLRASEVCDLQWHQVELGVGRLHVRRAKRGTPSVHPTGGCPRSVEGSVSGHIVTVTAPGLGAQLQPRSRTPANTSSTAPGTRAGWLRS